jgi:plasmid stability protein
MANLLVRNIDDKLVSALKARAGRHGISAEEEHRRILQTALQKPVKKTFSEILQSMPDVGQDSDFERKQNSEKRDVFN